jgi:hypothetical protein
LQELRVLSDCVVFEKVFVTDDAEELFCAFSGISLGNKFWNEGYFA